MLYKIILLKGVPRKSFSSNALITVSFHFQPFLHKSCRCTSNTKQNIYTNFIHRSYHDGNPSPIIDQGKS